MRKLNLEEPIKELDLLDDVSPTKEKKEPVRASGDLSEVYDDTIEKGKTYNDIQTRDFTLAVVLTHFGFELSGLCFNFNKNLVFKMNSKEGFSSQHIRALKASVLDGSLALSVSRTVEIVHELKKKQRAFYDIQGEGKRA